MKRLVSPARWRRDTWILAVGLSAFVVVSSQAACGHGAKACAVVDVAAEACKVVRYLAPDGTTEELSAEDLADLAKAKKTARERAAKAVP